MNMKGMFFSGWFYGFLAGMSTVSIGFAIPTGNWFSCVTGVVAILSSLVGAALMLRRDG